MIMQNILYYMDCFKSKPAFYINDKIKISSGVSKFLTFLMIAVIIFFFTDDFVRYIKLQNFQYNYSMEPKDPNLIDIINRTDIMFAIRISDEKLQKDFYKYFDIYFESTNYSIDQTDDNVNQIQQMDICTRNHFPQISQENFYNANLNQSFCLPLDYQLSLKYSSQYDYFGNIKIKNCNVSNSSCININEPANLDDFKNKYKQLDQYFTIQYINTNFYPKKTEQPWNQFIQNVYIHFQPNAGQYQMLRYFTENYIIKQDFPLFQILKQGQGGNNGYKINEQYTQYQSLVQPGIRNDSLILSLRISIFNDIQQIEINYEKFAGIFLKLFSNIKTFSIIFGALSMMANQNYFKIIVAKQLFGLKLNNNLKTIIKLYNLDDNLISKKKQKIINKYLDFPNLIKTLQFQKIQNQSQISHQSRILIDIITRKFSNINELQKYAYSLIQARKYKLNKKRFQSFQQISRRKTKFKLNLKMKIQSAIDQQSQNLSISQVSELNQESLNEFQKNQNQSQKFKENNNQSQNQSQKFKENNNQSQNQDQKLKENNNQSQNQDQKEDIYNAFFIKFVNDLETLNQNEVQKFHQDTSIEQFFKLYLEKEFNFKINYEFYRKLEQYSIYAKSQLQELITHAESLIEKKEQPIQPNPIIKKNHWFGEFFNQN